MDAAPCVCVCVCVLGMRFIHKIYLTAAPHRTRSSYHPAATFSLDGKDERRRASHECRWRWRWDDECIIIIERAVHTTRRPLVLPPPNPLPRRTTVDGSDGYDEISTRRSPDRTAHRVTSYTYYYCYRNILVVVVVWYYKIMCNAIRSRDRISAIKKITPERTSYAHRVVFLFYWRRYIQKFRFCVFYTSSEWIGLLFCVFSRWSG